MLYLSVNTDLFTRNIQKENWANLSTYFKYPEAVRRLIYTTNAIEGFNRQLRKVTKSKTVFPSDESLLKMLYLAMMDITKNGAVTDRIGDISIRSWRYFLKNGYPDYKQSLACQGWLS